MQRVQRGLRGARSSQPAPEAAKGYRWSDAVLALAVARSLPWHEQLEGAGELLRCAVRPSAVCHSCLPLTPCHTPEPTGIYAMHA